MNKIILQFLILILLTSETFTQFGWRKIYDQTFHKINRALIFPNQGLTSSSLYIQLGLDSASQTNNAGRVYKLNKSTHLFNSVFNGGFDRIWSFVINPPPPHFIVSLQNYFVVSGMDITFALRNYIPGCFPDCGDGTYITWNSGVNWTTIPQLGNGFLGTQSRGFDIDPYNDTIMYSAYSRITSGWLLIYKSTSKGKIWSLIDSVVAQTTPIPTGFLKINPFRSNYLYIRGDTLLVSSNSGMGFTWAQGSFSFVDIEFNRFDSSMIAYRSSSFYKSTDFGLSWSVLGSLPEQIRSLALSPDNPNNCYAGTDFAMYFSGNGGATWVRFNDSFTPSTKVIGISKDLGSGDTVYAVTEDAVYKVWGSFVSVNQNSNYIPERYSLFQNYPNPFNPYTNIKFQIPKSGFVNLTVYDIIGREIQTIVKQELSFGTYEVDFDGSNLPSGVYYYKLETEEYAETKKMVLIK